MRITVHFTRNTLQHPENIRFITYIRQQNEVGVFVSGDRNWHTGDLIAGRWQDFVACHPQFKIEFQEGHHALEYSDGRLIGEIE